MSNRWTLFLTAMMAFAGVSLVPPVAEAACNGGACPLSGGGLLFSSGVGSRPLPRAVGFTNPIPTGQLGLGFQNRVTGPIAPQGPVNLNIVGGANGTINVPNHAMALPAQTVNQPSYGTSGGTILDIILANGWEFPDGNAVFSPGGRSGPANASFCGGGPVPPNGLDCENPNSPGWPGRVTYMATGAQFGGSAGNSASVNDGSAFVGVGCNPTLLNPGDNCRVFAGFGIDAAVPFGPGAGWSSGTNMAATLMGGFVNLALTPAYVDGAITDPDSFVAGTPGTWPSFIPLTIPSGMTSSVNGPWTTGVVQIEQPLPAGAGGGFVTFTLTGTDSRDANGTGIVSMVSGSLQLRTSSGPGASFGLMELQVPEAGMASALLAGVSLLAVTAARRKR